MNLIDLQHLAHLHQGRLSAAIYLFRQGPDANPCPVEVQYNQILRYIECLEKALKCLIQIESVQVDIRYDRYRTESFLNARERPEGFARLCEEVTTHTIPLVFFSQEDTAISAERAIRAALLEQGQPIILNVSQDPYQLLTDYIQTHYGTEGVARMSRMSTTDFFAFFPQLAGNLIYTVLRDLRNHEGTSTYSEALSRVVDQLQERSYHCARYREVFPLWVIVAIGRERQRAADLAREARRHSDTLYRLGPNTTVLVDEQLSGLSSTLRSVEELPAVTTQLSTLGFSRTTEGREVSVTRTIGSWLIFADTRAAEGVCFYGYQQRDPIVTRAGQRRRVPPKKGAPLFIPNAQLEACGPQLLAAFS